MIIFITASAAAQAVVRTVFDLKANHQILTLPTSKTPCPIRMKFGTIDYVGELYRHAKFGSIRFTRRVSPHTWNITKKVYIFIFLSSNAPQTAILHRFWWLMAQTTRFDARKCLLGMRTVKIHNLGIFYPQNHPQFAPTMLIKAKTNIRNNFLTVQDTPKLIMNR